MRIQVTGLISGEAKGPCEEYGDLRTRDAKQTQWALPNSIVSDELDSQGAPLDFGSLPVVF